MTTRSRTRTGTIADSRTLDDAIQALEALRTLAAPPPRERTDLALKSPATATTRSAS